jgi:hypothetical protein
MQRKARGARLDGKRYDKLFSPANGIDTVVKKKAELKDTIDLFPEYVPRYAYQAKLLAEEKGDKKGDVHNSCYNIWHFLVNYIAYEPDTPGIEQIRSTNRLWSDKLGDCDCFAFTISCYLYQLKINHILRVTQYKEKDGFQHIYVVVPHRGKEIIIDACLESFNIEVPYINKIDKEMDLHFLNGLSSETIARNGGSVDADEFFQLADLGSIKSFVQKAKQDVKKVVQKTTTVVKKSVHVINRVNPAITTVRLGILAAMKTNFLKVAENLRYAYLSELDAVKQKLNSKRHTRYKKVREKLEKMFFAAGGKPDNLKTAILSGKGNEDKEVALSGYGSLRGFSDTINPQTHIREVLGEEMYADEMPQQGVNGTATLGVVAATAVASASGIIAAIAAILKNIGNIKTGGEPGADSALDEISDTAPTDEESVDTSSGDAPADATVTSGDEVPSEPIPAVTNSIAPDEGNQAPPQTTPADNGASSPPSTAKTTTDTIKEFYDKYKTPIFIAGGVIVTVVGVLVARHFIKKSATKKAVKKAKAKEVNGVPRKGKYAGSKVLRKLKMKPLR